MGNHAEIERSDKWLFDFTKLQKVATKLDPSNPVIPVVVQDANTLEVLIIAYANDEALKYSLKEGIATFWSTSRNELWIKGKTSGDTLNLKEVRINFDQNSLLYLVEPARSGACHVKDKDNHAMRSCYYRKVEYNKEQDEISLKTISGVSL